MKKKGNKKMPFQDRKSLITPSLHLCLCAILGCNLRTNQNTCKCVQLILMKNKDVGMGLSMISCLGIGITFLI